jgi:outer membrane biosynthesis protein TonB
MRRFGRDFGKLIPIRRNISTVTLFLLLCLMSIAAPFLRAQTATAQKAGRKIVLKVDPDYPTFLRNGHFEGLVIIEATVQPNGNVSKADIKGGNPMLSQYAAAAVLHWKYAPGPEKTTEEVIFHFNANDR